MVGTLFGPEGPTDVDITWARASNGSEPTLILSARRGIQWEGRDRLNEGLSCRPT